LPDSRRPWTSSRPLSRRWGNGFTADVEIVDREIDRLVYERYELTEREITILEGWA
jgi:hypothetical protein